MRISQYTQNNFSKPSFQKVYATSNARDLLDTIYTHGHSSLQNTITASVKSLETLTKKLDTDIVIEKGADEFAARVVEAKDVLDGDTYKVTNYLTGEAKLQDVLKDTIAKLSKRLSKQTEPKKTRRRPFPGRQTLNING